ncbi:hypothetical protein ACHAXN_001954 [Cyclotella atomus]
MLVIRSKSALVIMVLSQLLLLRALLKKILRHPNQSLPRAVVDLRVAKAKDRRLRKLSNEMSND